MNDTTYLNDGDATFSSSFVKVMRSEDGYQFKAAFKPSKGKEFVVLLLGEVDKGSTYADAEEMLNALGFYRIEKLGSGDD